MIWPYLAPVMLAFVAGTLSESGRTAWAVVLLSGSLISVLEACLRHRTHKQ